jgi:hypothetical protein
VGNLYVLYFSVSGSGNLGRRQCLGEYRGFSLFRGSVLDPILLFRHLHHDKIFSQLKHRPGFLVLYRWYTYQYIDYVVAKVIVHVYMHSKEKLNICLVCMVTYLDKIVKKVVNVNLVNVQDSYQANQFPRSH